MLVQIVLLLILSSVILGNPTAWKEEINYNWSELDHKTAFLDWKTEFGKIYDDINEEGHRFLIFLNNWKMINDFNINSKHNYTIALNQFGDLTRNEFRYYIHGHGESCVKTVTVTDVGSSVCGTNEIMNNIQIPTSIDWTNINGNSYVTSVKNQGQCGSCWAFSATGSTESASAIKNQQINTEIVVLSEQELIDCSRNSTYHNKGCDGGSMDDAFKYIFKANGLCTEYEYPYKAKNGNCKASSCGIKYDMITGCVDVQSDSMSELQAAIAIGPVSIAIEADQSAFQFYSSGILDGLCGTKLDHGVLVVGYGSEMGQGYWKVKNSWGTSWGMKGYVLICRNCNKNGDKGECGILMTPSYPTV